jgi:hypothetical protein
VGAFFRGLLHFYGLEVTHVKPNSIVRIVIFIHNCESYLGITTHFNLWRALYRLRGNRSTIRLNMVGGAAFSLHQGREYLESTLQDSNKEWNKEWFIVAIPATGLPPRTGHAPVYQVCWEDPPTEEEIVQVEDC